MIEDSVKTLDVSANSYICAMKLTMNETYFWQNTNSQVCSRCLLFNGKIRVSFETCAQWDHHSVLIMSEAHYGQNLYLTHLILIAEKSFVRFLTPKIYLFGLILISEKAIWRNDAIAWIWKSMIEPVQDERRSKICSCLNWVSSPRNQIWEILQLSEYESQRPRHFWKKNKSVSVWMDSQVRGIKRKKFSKHVNTWKAIPEAIDDMFLSSSTLS